MTGFRQVPRSLRYRDRQGKTKVQAEAHCRLCLRENTVRPLTRHHLIPQEWFRKQIRRHGAIAAPMHADANIVPLCEPCHREVESPDGITRRMLRRRLTQAEITFIIHVIGKPWLDNRYPPREKRPVDGVASSGMM